MQLDCLCACIPIRFLQRRETEMILEPPKTRVPKVGSLSMCLHPSFGTASYSPQSVHEPADLRSKWWHVPVIPVLRMLRKENCEFVGSVGHI